jgi:hypothetical protein
MSKLLAAHDLYAALFAHGGVLFAKDDFPAFVAPVAIVALVIIGVIVALVVNARWERQRTEALAAVAAGLGFDFFPKGDDRLVGEFGPFHLFQIGRAKTIKNFMQGAAQGLTISLFDYFYTTGSGKSQHTTVQSVFVAHRAGMNLPAFSVRPKSFWDRIGHLFGTKDVEFESHPAFNKTCLVKGTDDVAIRAVFSEPLMDYFVAHPKVQVEGTGERLMYYRGERVKPEKLRDFMAEGFEVLNLFPPN